MPDIPYSPNIQQLEVLINGGSQAGWSNGMKKMGDCLYNDKDMAVDRVFMPAGTLFTTHLHDLTEILVCVSGQIAIKTADENHQLRPADVIKISPKTLHSCEAIENSWMIGILIPAVSDKAQGVVL